MTDGSTPSSETETMSAVTRRPVWQQALPWLITLACFAYLYGKLSGAAGREGLSLPSYLGGVFANVDWGNWLLLMVPYSFFFFLIDTGVVWRVINYFNTRVAYRDMLPIRGSSYILSILNEQVGKGAMGLYLNRRYGVPGWEVGSSMLFIMFCEFYYLLGWATVGWWIGKESLPEVFGWIPWVAAVASLVFIAWIFVFRGQSASLASFRDKPIFKAFREASPRHYGMVVLMRSPALLAAVVVYTLALQLFGVEVGFVQMLGYLPVIFFGAATPGPMRTVAITLWVVLFPGNKAGEMAAFGLVQHNFFIFFNAAIGLIFLRRANRELFD
ncbi:MAG: hypothetical protein P8Q97_16020 [Myxococcota bacterium]|jgi:hypothetical protein|nr:hypothetical protein [Myxococcota bacterium]